jgi:hypothetical protein
LLPVGQSTNDPNAFGADAELLRELAQCRPDWISGVDRLRDSARKANLPWMTA